MALHGHTRHEIDPDTDVEYRRMWRSNALAQCVRGVRPGGYYVVPWGPMGPVPKIRVARRAPVEVVPAAMLDASVVAPTNDAYDTAGTDPDQVTFFADGNFWLGLPLELDGVVRLDRAEAIRVAVAAWHRRYAGRAQLARAEQNSGLRVFARLRDAGAV